MKPMNKRGFLLGEETVKIIIAVIAIIFLVALIVGLYTTLSKNKDLEYAKATMDNLAQQINAKAEQVYIYNPKNWFLSSFPQKDSKGNELMPKSCSSVGWKNCVCVYKLSTYLLTGVPKPADESVDNEGSCKEENFTVVGTIYPSDIVIKGISPSLSGIPINNPPVSLTIDYSTNEIKESSGKTEFHTNGQNG